jgi:carbon monoxide dehydrogenase subunit G
MRNPDAWGRRKREVPSTTVQLADRIEMPVSADVAWRHVQDIQAVAACIPGLVPGSLEQVSEDAFRGTLRHLALGVPSTWRLEAVVTRADPDRRLDIHLDGEEERLDLHLSGDAALSIDQVDELAALTYTGDLTVRGRLAGAGGPIIERVVASIIERFVESVGAGGQVAPHRSWWQRLVAWVTAPFGRRD